jgi:tetraacyldisaccharide 4'-kinase
MRFILYPLSLIYGSVIYLRNLLFDMEFFKSKTHPIPIICIGNLSVGGSGKTPHTNYISQLLTKEYKVGILSRGYGRKNKGFSYVNNDSTPINVGDEPLLLKQNNPTCVVAVNDNRNKGAQKMLTDHPELEVILLDDAYQHRWIKAGLNILISPFYKPFYRDELLPLGTLREDKSGSGRADIIITSKTPYNTNPTLQRGMLESMDLKAHQKIYFSSITYKEFKCMSSDEDFIPKENYSITLVSGIVNPKPLVEQLENKGHTISQITFKDHHSYTTYDTQKILAKYNADESVKKLILTTEKDATKLRELLAHFEDANFYYIPIDIAFSEQESFDRQILNYVAKN